jgi:hypothetical protein
MIVEKHPSTWLAALFARPGGPGTIHPHDQYIRWSAGPARWEDRGDVMIMVDGYDGHVMGVVVFHVEDGVLYGANVWSVAEMLARLTEYGR